MSAARRALSTMLALALFRGGAGPAVAQQEPPAFGENLEVEVVNVDVIVTDLSGRRVTDLEIDDFQLFVDGQPVSVDYFAPPAAPASGPDLEAQPAEPMPLAPRELPATEAPSNLVFFVDQSALAQHTRQETLAELRAYLAGPLQPARQILVAAFQDDLRILAAPTTDPAAVEAAFAALERLPARATAIEAERKQLEMEIRNYGRAVPMVRSEIDPEGDVAREVRLAASERVRIQNEIEIWGERELDRQSRSVRALARIVEALEAVEGRKAVVLATSGYSSEPAQFLLQFFAQKLGVNQGGQITRVPRLDELGVALAAELERLVAAAENARVAFYTVSPREPPPAQNSAEFGSVGAGTGGSAPPPKDASAIAKGGSVIRLSSATGGRSFYLDERLDAELREIEADGGAAYSLGFTTDAGAGIKDHRIEVRIARPGLEVRHRESFRRRRPEERSEGALVAAVTLGSVRNPFGLAIELGEVTAGAKKGDDLRLPIAIRIPISALALLPRGAESAGRLLLKLAIQDGGGRVTFDAGTPIPITVGAGDLARAQAGVWVHRAELELAPGRHRIAVLVADQQGGDFSTVVRTVDVAAP